MAHMRYTIWGNIAEKEGFKNVARLFRAIGFAEQVHASNHFRVIDGATTDASVTAGGVFGVGKTAENLQGAINGELHEVEQMYPVYINAAEFQKEPGAKHTFTLAWQAEKIHAQLFQRALDSVKAGKDLELTTIYVCPVCGYTAIDEIAEKCPICGTKKEQYKEF